MAGIFANVDSDIQKLQQLKREIENVKKALGSVNVNIDIKTGKNLEGQLKNLTDQYNALVGKYAEAERSMREQSAKSAIEYRKQQEEIDNLIRKYDELLKKTQSGNGSRPRGPKTYTEDQITEALNTQVHSIKEAREQLKVLRFAVSEVTDEQEKEFRTRTKLNAKIQENNNYLKQNSDAYTRQKMNVGNYEQDIRKAINTNGAFTVSLSKLLATIGGISVFKQLATEIVTVRGQFQQLEIAFSTMLKSKEKADNLMSELVDIAAKTPFDLQGVADSAKQMLAYGSQVEHVGSELVMLGNVAAGVGSTLGEIAYLYGTLRTQGRAYATDIRQFAGRGIPIYEELAKVLGVTKDEVSELVTAGKVGFKEVEQAFKNMTSESGIYYNLMEEQSKSLTGQISNLGDAWDTMLNEIGKGTQGIAASSIAGLKSLIENYETVGKILVGLVATYGAYRTAIMLTTIAESKHTLVEIGLTNVRILARKAQLALNAAMLTNPYVLLATAIAGTVAVMLAFRDSTTAVEKGIRRYNEEQENAAKLDSERKQKIDDLIQSSRNIALSDLQRGESLAALRSEYPKIFAQYDIESIKLADILQLKQQIAKEDAKRAGEEVARNFEAANKAVSDYENTLSAKQINGGKLTQQEINKLKELRSYRDQFLVEKGKGISEQFISSLKDVDISEFDRYISELEKRIKGKGENGTVKLRLPIDIKGTLSDEAIYNVKDIKTLIDTAKSAKQTRIDSEKNKTTYKQDYEKAKKEWDDAKKKLSEIEKDKSKFTSKQYEEAKEQEKTAKERYEGLGGVTDKTLEKQKKQAEKDAEEQKKQQERINEELLSLRRQNQQDEIYLMKEGTEKKLEQIELDYQKEIDAIRKREQEWTEASGGELTKEQSAQISLSYSLAEIKRDKSIEDFNKEKLESDRKSWQEYFIEFGNYQEKRKYLIQKYDDEISKLQEKSPEYAIKVAEKERALEQLDEQYGKSTRAMADLFEDASTKSVSAIQDIIDKYELLIKYMSGTDTSISIEDLKASRATAPRASA